MLACRALYHVAGGAQQWGAASAGRGPLAAFAQRAQRAALGDAAGVQRWRSKAAVWWMAFKQWRCYSFSGGEDGLGSLSLPCSLKGLSGLRSVAQQAFKGSGALAGGVPLRGRWFRAQWRYGFGSGEGRLGGLSSPRSFGKFSGLRYA